MTSDLAKLSSWSEIHNPLQDGSVAVGADALWRLPVASGENG
jgi:hypothetical protein